MIKYEDIKKELENIKYHIKDLENNLDEADKANNEIDENSKIDFCYANLYFIKFNADVVEGLLDLRRNSIKREREF